MSCKECDEQHEGWSAFYRWKNANILMKGCDTHLSEVFVALNLIQKEGKLTMTMVEAEASFRRVVRVRLADDEEGVKSPKVNHSQPNTSRLPCK